jgi:hypothetical protein
MMADSSEMKPVTVYTALNPMDAQLVRSRLEAAGFHPFVADENAALGTDGYALAIGGIRVQVPESEVTAVREFLDQNNA